MRINSRQLYATTPAASGLVERYRLVRERCLPPTLGGDVADRHELQRTADLLRALSGVYDQAARAAASL